MRIIIVDDNEDNRIILKKMLQRAGHVVQEAQNGAEALNLIQASAPDMIISDILMPVMDGFQLCRRVKGDDTLNSILFVFYTATYTDSKDEEFALSLGAERFLRKPQEPEAFVGMLREVIEQHKAGQMVVKRKPVAEEAVYLKLCNEALIRKLEDKMEQLEEANKVLEQEITERKRLEEERGRLLADLEAKNRELEAFVYTISHNLKAPLISLNGFSFALQKDPYSQLGKEGKHYVERIQANVAHMDDLITSLLGLSRIGRVVGPIEEIDVRLLLTKIREQLAVRIEDAGAEFVVQEPLPTVRADRGRIHQVFVNLMENAVKFRSAERALRIEVGCRQESGFYCFHVADNGIGIAPQYHEQIFAPCQKLHPEIEGVGIGLALVKKIVEHHGGRVWVQSEAGKGATFYFTIPKADDRD